MATSLSSLLGGLFQGASGYSGISGYSGVGQSGFSGYSGAGQSGFSGYSGTGGSGFSGYSGGGSFNGGTITNPLFVNNATTTVSAGGGALQVLGDIGAQSNVYVSGNILEPNQNGTYIEALPIKKYVLEANQVISLSTLVNVSGFSFPLTTVGATYGFEFYVVYSGATTNSALGVALTFPGAQEFAAHTRIPLSGTLFQLSNLTTTGVKAQSASVPSANSAYLGWINGVITVSTSGTLQLQASNAINGATTSFLTVRRGTAGWIWRIR